MIKISSLKTLFVFISILFTFCSLCFSYDFAGGTGEPNDPYQIETAEQLLQIGSDANLLDKSFILNDDINLDPNLPGNTVFEDAIIAPVIYISPTSFEGVPFAGHFNGDGHIISNIVIQAEDEKYIGLFGCIGNGGIVQDIAIENAFIISDKCVGILAGGNKGIVKSCYTTGDIQLTAYGGGLIGVNMYGAEVNSCYSNAEVIGGSYIGGLVGYNCCTVSCCYSTGYIKGTSHPGGLIGTGSGVYLSYWDMQTSKYYNFNRSKGEGKFTSEMKKLYTFIGWGNGCWKIDNGNSYPHLIWENVPGELIPPVSFNSGNGSPDDPYQINNAFQILLIAADETFLDKSFILVNDVNMADLLPFGEEYEDALISDDYYYDQYGFQGPSFIGIFDGNNNTIYNLKIHITLPYVQYTGLFGCLGPNGQIKNLKLRNTIIRSGMYTGALVALNNNGCISNCDVEGNIFSGNKYTGFIAGINEEDGLIQNCHTSGQIKYSHYYVGALVGDNEGIIDYSNSDVTILSGDSHSNDYVGGLAGKNKGIITNSYYNGQNVFELFPHPENLVGGLAAINSGLIKGSFSSGILEGFKCGGIVSINEGEICSCYSQSLISSGCYIGGIAELNIGTIIASYSSCYDIYYYDDMNEIYAIGLVNRNEFGSVFQSFWDTKNGYGGYSPVGEPKTTDQLKNKDTFKGWGYDGLWKIDDGNDYPRLVWQNTPGEIIIDPNINYSGGDGTEQNPYKISTPEELSEIYYHLEHYNKSFILTDDIDLAYFEPNHLKPIGFSRRPFKGVFDGNHHIIKNFTLLSDELYYLGFFGCLGESTEQAYDIGAEIQNLKIEKINLSGEAIIGGLVAFNNGTISNCTVSGNIIDSNDFVGGLVGYNDFGIIENCKSSVEINDCNGGIGGLIGINFSGEIINSSSFANITGNRVVGGLIGSNYGSVNNCSAFGDVNSKTFCAGGLIGYIHNVVIYSYVKNCYSKGNTNSPSHTGGLIGYAPNGFIQNCYATGHPAGQDYIGALIGYTNNTFIDSTFWDIESSGTSDGIGNLVPDPDGVFGLPTEQMQIASTFIDAGWDFNDIWTICEGTNYPKLQWQILPADFLCPDGVDFIDYSFFSNHWMMADCNDFNDCSSTDFDFSSCVDANDLDIFTTYWLLDK